MSSILPELGLALGAYLGGLLTIQFFGMFIGYVLRALFGEVLSWLKAAPGEDGFMTRMWVTHTLVWFVLDYGRIELAKSSAGGVEHSYLFAAGALLLFKANRVRESSEAGRKRWRQELDLFKLTSENDRWTAFTIFFCGYLVMVSVAGWLT